MAAVCVAVAVGAFAFLVFGPTADSRALELAGSLAMSSSPVEAVGAPADAARRRPERLPGAAPRRLYEAQ